jgi:hypothetical protein
MGNSISSIKKSDYEDIQEYVRTRPDNVVLINTLTEHEQDCLIESTLDAKKETKIMNEIISKKRKAKVIIYGKNYYDESVIKQYIKIQKLGVSEVSIYLGGIFEWLCLQEIYGSDLFPTTSTELDILKYKPHN